MRRVLPVLVTVGLLVAVGACGDDEGEPGATGSTPSPTTATTVEGGQALVFFVRDEKVAAAGTALGGDDEPTAAVEALLEGPDAFDADIGMTTEIPDATELLGLEIDRGEAKVDLSAAFTSGGGSLSMQLRVAQIVFTLTRFPAVDTVSIFLDGAPATEGVGGEGVPAVGVDRSDSAGVTPAILVESPVPGEEVTAPLTVSGIADTFEANVRYTVTDPEGLILTEGFTTATAGNGTWGDFEVEVDFQTDRIGLGAVIAFQDDAETGAQRDVYEVPVRMG